VSNIADSSTQPIFTLVQLNISLTEVTNTSSTE
jgi:hypothetical protein